jgi:ABC-type oligopeptide transport system substrate-binding subunit
MKMIPYLLILLLMLAVGCASERYSESSYQDKQVLKEYIQNHPDYYQKWREEEP